MGEKLSRIGQAFEFERITGGIGQEEGCLLTDLAFEAYTWRDQKFGAGMFQPGRKIPPGVHVQNDTKVPRRYGVAIYRIGPGVRGIAVDEMQRDLVTKKVQIDPTRRRAAGFAAKQTAIEFCGSVKIGYRDREVKRRH